MSRQVLRDKSLLQIFKYKFFYQKKKKKETSSLIVLPHTFTYNRIEFSKLAIN